jgi:hypothetical protein
MSIQPKDRTFQAIVPAAESDHCPAAAIENP